MSNRIGLYGGSFDPIHFGHLISARALAEAAGLSRVVLIPSGRPPHKSGIRLADGAHRLEMVRRAVESDPLFEVSDWEVRRTEPSYTLHTVEHFRTVWPGAELVWIIGADSLPELSSWHRVAELVRTVRIVTATRPGLAEPDMGPLRRVLADAEVERLLADRISTPAIEISATDIRRRVQSGKSVRYLVPEFVRLYIESHGLYIA